MPEWLARVRQEAAVIASAPIAFTVIILVAGAVMWTVIHLSYGAHISSKNNQIVFLERRLAEWRDKMSGMSPDEVRTRLNNLETQVKGLQIRLQPRSLTSEQKQALTDRARQRPGLQSALAVVRQAECSDCDPFASQIVGALQASGSWSVTTAAQPDIAEKPRYGLGIRVTDPLRPPPDAVQLQNALRSAGISFDMVAGGAAGLVELLVTERPSQ